MLDEARLVGQEAATFLILQLQEDRSMETLVGDRVSLVGVCV